MMDGRVQRKNVFWDVRTDANANAEDRESRDNDVVTCIRERNARCPSLRDSMLSAVISTQHIYR